MSIKSTILCKVGDMMENHFASKARKHPPAIPLVGEPQTRVWYTIPIEGGVCTDSSPYYIYARKGTVDALAIILLGGGASWNAETAKYQMTFGGMLSGGTTLYNPRLGPVCDYTVFMSNKKPGILAVDEPDNPFKDWNLIAINYATADFLVGQNDLPYTDVNGKHRIMRHQGYANFTKSMDVVTKLVPSTRKLLIMGGSAGAFAVPALTSRIMDRYPECKDVTVYSDSALVLYSDWPNTVRNIWKAPDDIASAVTSSNITADWFKMLMNDKGDNIRYLYSNSTQDAVFAAYQNYIDNGKASATAEYCKLFQQILKDHIAKLKQINPRFSIYINDFKNPAPKGLGTEHCVNVSPSFYRKNAAGVSTVQWLLDAVNGNVYDSGMELL